MLVKIASYSSSTGLLEGIPVVLSWAPFRYPAEVAKCECNVIVAFSTGRSPWPIRERTSDVIPFGGDVVSFGKILASDTNAARILLSCLKRSLRGLIRYHGGQNQTSLSRNPSPHKACGQPQRRSPPCVCRCVFRGCCFCLLYAPHRKCTHQPRFP